MAAVDLNLNSIVGARSPADNNSRKNFWYKDDTGQFHSARALNEDQAELFGFFQTVPSGGVISTTKIIKKRRTISFSDTSGSVKGTFEVGRPDAAIFTDGGTVVIPRKATDAGLIVTIKGAQGEKAVFADPNLSSDSGQLSGDNP